MWFERLWKRGGESMHEVESSKSWRAMLGELIQEPKERGRLAAHLGVNPTTLMRWAFGAQTAKLAPATPSIVRRWPPSFS